MMTKKDYKMLVEVIRKVRDCRHEDVGFYQRCLLTELENALVQDNPRFDENKFEEAIYGN